MHVEGLTRGACAVGHDIKVARMAAEGKALVVRRTRTVKRAAALDDDDD